MDDETFKAAAENAFAVEALAEAERYLRELNAALRRDEAAGNTVPSASFAQPGEVKERTELFIEAASDGQVREN